MKQNLREKKDKLLLKIMNWFETELDNEQKDPSQLRIASHLYFTLHREKVVETVVESSDELKKKRIVLIEKTLGKIDKCFDYKELDTVLLKTLASIYTNLSTEGFPFENNVIEN